MKTLLVVLLCCFASAAKDKKNLSDPVSFHIYEVAEHRWTSGCSVGVSDGHVHYVLWHGVQGRGCHVLPVGSTVRGRFNENRNHVELEDGGTKTWIVLSAKEAETP